MMMMMMEITPIKWLEAVLPPTSEEVAMEDEDDDAEYVA